MSGGEIGVKSVVKNVIFKVGSLYGGFLFFFFQAEDGIGDKLVTGVQTCAFRSVSCGPSLRTAFICVDAEPYVSSTSHPSS